MSLYPKVKRILVPPGAVPSKNASVTSQLAAVTNLNTHTSKNNRSNNNSSSIESNNNTNTTNNPGPVYQKHMKQHPILPWVTYILETNSPVSMNKVVCVQNTISGEIIFNIHWMDLAALVYGETESKKLPAAAKSLGNIVSLNFYDTHTLFWSRICTVIPQPTTTTTTTDNTNTDTNDNKNNSNNNNNINDNYNNRFQILLIQTDRRVLLVNIRRGPDSSVQILYIQKSTAPQRSLYNVLQAHICEKTVNAIPSSNVLPITDQWVLVGCVDGSMKCYNWYNMSIVKKIKGLGKGDCVIQILPANPYCNKIINNNTKRILTVTKKGTVYLIQLEFSTSSTNNTNNTIDIKPPNARFQITSILTNNISSNASTVTANTNTTNTIDNDPDNTMEHCLYSYDGHCDRFQWMVPGKEPVLYIWNLSTITDNSNSNNPNTTSSSSSMLKPDPTLIIKFPAVSAATTFMTTGGGGGLGLANLISSAQGMTTPAGTNKDDTATTTKDSTTGGTIFATNAAFTSSVTIVTGIVHTAFSPETVVTVTVTATGDLCLHGSTAAIASTYTTTMATPVMLIHLKQAIIQAVDSLHETDDVTEEASAAEFKVYAVTTQPLGSVGTELIVSTNWGLVVLDLPVYSNTIVQSKSMANGTRHVHFGGGLGSLGKSVIMVQQSTVRYGSLDVLTANPIGYLEPKNQVTVYESPQAQHMPIEFYKRPFRLAPILMPSPTGLYTCLLWPCEYRYEVLHVPTLLQHVNQLRSGNITSNAQRRNPVVATGTGICDFAWVSDNDIFAILHAPDLQEQAIIQVPKINEEAGSYNIMSPNLKMIGAGALGVANLATSVTKTATSATLSAAVNTTMTVTKGATNAANMTVGVTTKAIRSGAKGVTKGVKKSLGIFGKKKKGQDAEESVVTADDEMEDEESVMSNAAALAMQASTVAELEALRAQAAKEEVRLRYVEFRGLELVEAQSVELSAGIPAATSISLGKLSLRGGNRNPPCAIFGGPVICVASRSDEDHVGHAYFYTRKKDDDGQEHNAASYISAGPTLPYPDLVAWDDDGRICAIVVANRVAVYISESPGFILLGTVRIAAPSVATAPVTSVKFVHGALYCCTWNSVHCVLLGDLNGGICHLDSYLLASTEVFTIPEMALDDIRMPFAPIPIPLPLVQPTVLGYQSGSLMVSTLRGVHAIPLTSPLMRIGLFLASGQLERASRWFDAVQNSDHEALASFLERRGYPEIALKLPGLSVETIVDFSMRYGYVDRLEDVVETYGVAGLRAIDLGRGISRSIFGPQSESHSVMVCVGAYLLAHGRVELTRRLATECLRSGEEGRKDAFLLGALLLPVDDSDATRLIQRAVEEDGGATEDWLIGNYVRKYVLSGDRH